MAMKVGGLNRITITRPDDWHLHLRDGAALKAVLPDTTHHFGRAIIMPNLRLPITTVKEALSYKERILAARPLGSEFQPLMTLYLTDRTLASIIRPAVTAGIVACKLYPAGATTNSENGVTDIKNIYPVLRAMEREDMVLCVHGEVTDPAVDIFDRENVFIDRVLAPLLKRFPGLRVVFEHITTSEAVQFVTEAGPNIAATITAHHLLLNRNAIFTGGIRPHHYCLPVLKRETHRQTLIAAAISGNPKYFLGTDSAPHARSTKESACGCAGIYTAHAGIGLYAEVFERTNALDKLEGFASHFGPDFYGLPRNKDVITLVKQYWRVPQDLSYIDGDPLVPFRAGELIHWQLAA